MAGIKLRREHNDQQVGGDVVIKLGRKWFRVALYIGAPPGSHIGYWRTKVALNLGGTLRGVNFRVGRRYVGPAVTFFVHWR